MTAIVQHITAAQAWFAFYYFSQPCLRAVCWCRKRWHQTVPQKRGGFFIAV